MVSKHELIFRQWVASLQSRDRSREAIRDNFDDLFHSLKNEGLTLEGAYEYLDKATKAHQPNASIVRSVYRRLKAAGRAFVPEEEFHEIWCKDIADKANASFFEVFPVDVKEEEDPIIFGNMSLKEYKAQRRHAEQYPRLDLEELERRMTSGNYNPVDDIKKLVGE